MGPEAESGNQGGVRVHFELNINTILEALSILGIAGIFKQLMTLNGSVGNMKVWQDLHTKQDDERHAELVGGQKALWNAMSKGKENAR